MERFLNYFKEHKFTVNICIKNCLLAEGAIIILGVIIYNVFINVIYDNLQNTFRYKNEQFNLSIESFFDEIDSLSLNIFLNDKVLSMLREDPELKDYTNVTGLRDYLSSSMMLKKEFRDLYVYTNSGQVCGTAFYANSQLISEIMQQNKEQIKDKICLVNLQGMYQNDKVAIIRPLRFPDDLTMAGYSIIVVNKEALVQLSPIPEYRDSMKLFVLDKNNDIVISESKNTEETLPYIKNITSNGMSQIDMPDGKYVVVQNYNDIFELRFIIMVPLQVLYEPTNAIKYTIIFSTTIIMFLSLVFLAKNNIFLSERIKKITDGLNEYAMGQKDIEIELESEDEFSIIVQSFNKMAKENHKMNKRIFETQQRLYEAELGKIESDIYMLQSQINSHFLYNTLGSMRGMARNGHINEMETIIDKLVQILRYATRAEENVTLDDELSNIEQYISIYNIRGQQIRLIIKNNLVSSSVLLQRLILQPLVENSIIHGFIYKRRKVIQITVDAEDDCLVIRIYDNGQGMKPDKLTEINTLLNNSNYDIKEHIGIMNIQKRIRERYGNRFGLEIKSRIGIGTVVIMRMPHKEVKD